MKNRKYLIHPSMQHKKKQTTQQTQPQQNIQQTSQQNQIPTKNKPESDLTKLKDQSKFGDKIRKFPRPLISSEQSKILQCHDSNESFEDPPSLFYQYYVKEQGNATCRHAHSSVYLLPENSSNLQKSQINFSVVFTPLAESNDLDTPTPYADKREKEILRCTRCGTFVNPFFIFKDNLKKYICNICEYEGEVSSKYLNNEEFSSEQFPESNSAVYDFIVPDSYKLNDISNNNILFCFDMSLQSIMNGSFNHILNSIKGVLDYLDSDVQLGFLVYEDVPSFLRIDNDEISILRCLDKNHPVCPLSFKELFLNAKEQKDMILQILSFLEKLAYTQYNEQQTELKNSAHCLETLSKSLLDLFSETGGRAVICTSIHKTSSNQIVSYKTKDKIYSFKPKVNTFQLLGSQLAQKSVTIDFFITSEDNMELQTISPLALNTGGMINYYPNFKIYTYSDQIYYDLHRLITVQRGFDVACRLRTSQGVQIVNYLTPIGKIHTLDFRIPSLTADQHIIAQMQLGENLKNTKTVYLQFVTLYTNSFDTRLMRIVNLALKVTNDMQMFYKNMDCHAFSYSFVRNEIDKLFSKYQKDVNDEILAESVKLFKYYRNEVGGRYESREFALPDRLKFFPLYIFSMLHQPCLNYKQSKNPDFDYYTLLQLCQTNMQKSIYFYYPKIYDVKDLFKNWSENPDQVQFGGEVDNLTVLPDSIPADGIQVQKDSVYLIDDGIFMYLYIQFGVNTELLQHLFGVESLQDLEYPIQLASIEDSEFNLRINAIVERIRNEKTGSIQQLYVIIESDENSWRIQNCFIESCQTSMTKNYWEFLSLLHEKVKDD